jgi:hypothetical protein
MQKLMSESENLAINVLLVSTCFVQARFAISHDQAVCIYMNECIHECMHVCVHECLAFSLSVLRSMTVCMYACMSVHGADGAEGF